MSIVKLFPFILVGITSINSPHLYSGTYYVVVIDAGSTGSRVHAYKFSLPRSRLKRDSVRKLRFEDELYVARKPGLSSYASNPKKGAESIIELIQKADSFVPKHMRAKTPLIVRATAGLRALPEAVSANLLMQIRVAIANLGYKINDNSVNILQGKDEGINMWYTVNLLTDTLEQTNPMSSLEMGGASAQVTFVLHPGEISNYLSKDVYVRPAVTNRTLFSRSYLGQGISAARLGTLQLEAGNIKTKKFISVCADPVLTKFEENFFGEKVEISGVSREGYSIKEVYLRCRKFVTAYIKATMGNVLQLKGLRKIAAMGYYYQFANDEGLIPRDKNGHVTIQNLLAHAVSPTGGCATHDKQNPWRCFDAIFIVTLLQYGYGIDKNSIIHLYDTIDNYNVEWTLGVAYNYVMAEITTNPDLIHVHHYLRKILSKMRK
ncbi:ectonucleoside triphosphate diphosphohydrolase 5-like [Hyposmocoma kahamanoa]|uniref:ectonucleoside triphosphate diphosphohydrolase 5-like n=1 Tax=Hyposmocoma kahamanoa TaxID=1477025 RepID=UPI000E6D9786|nr:ectonucleoside triphosphate diphosphohydrolase 5-like [Hyposmocoma kahamanoa]